MEHERAWYSFVQYRPTAETGEGANVGLLGFAPAKGFVRLRLSQSNSRARRMFGAEAVDAVRLTLMKEMFASRLDPELAEVRSVEQLKAVLSREANRLVFTPLREWSARNPRAEFDALFARTVDGEQPARAPQPRKLPEMRELARRLLEDGVPIEMASAVEIPHLDESLHSDFSYQNGQRNLVLGRWFHKHPRDAARNLASQGCVLSHSTAAKLVVVSRVDDADVAKDVREIFRSHGVECVDHTAIAAFEKRLRREAH